MATLRIEIEMDGAAFFRRGEADPAHEVASILTYIKNRIANGRVWESEGFSLAEGSYQKLADSNGAIVGFARVEGETTNGE